MKDPLQHNKCTAISLPCAHQARQRPYRQADHFTRIEPATQLVKYVRPSTRTMGGSTPKIEWQVGITINAGITK